MFGEERISLAMAAESAGGGLRLAPAAEVHSDLLKRRFIDWFVLFCFEKSLFK